MLSPVEAAALDRGQALKRYVRAGAALNDLYDDTALADAVGVQRGAVRGWWTGAQMQPDTIRRVAKVTGLSPDELTRFVYFDGPPPTLTPPEGPPPPILGEVSDAERQAAAEKLGSGSPPRTPGSGRRGGGKATRRHEGEPA